jgi:hypothetical protein
MQSISFGISPCGEPDQIPLRKSPSACLERLSDCSIIFVIQSGVYYVADSPDGSIRVHLFWQAHFRFMGGENTPVSFVDRVGGRNTGVPGL